MLVMISSFVLLLPSYSDCTREQLRDFVNRNKIRICLLAADNEVLLHIANGMAHSSQNINAKYKILGVSSFVIPRIK